MPNIYVPRRKNPRHPAPCASRTRSTTASLLLNGTVQVRSNDTGQRAQRGDRRRFGAQDMGTEPESAKR